MQKICALTEDLESVYLKFISFMRWLQTCWQSQSQSISFLSRCKTKYSNNQTCTSSIAHFFCSFPLLHPGVLLALSQSPSRSRSLSLSTLCGGSEFLAVLRSYVSEQEPPAMRCRCWSSKYLWSISVSKVKHTGISEVSSAMAEGRNRDPNGLLNGYNEIRCMGVLLRGVFWKCSSFAYISLILSIPEKRPSELQKNWRLNAKPERSLHKRALVFPSS